MDILNLEVKRRTGKGKSAARQLRRGGQVPAVVYGIHESTSLAVSPKELERVLGTRAGANVIVQLNVAGEAKSDRPVLIKDLQRDAIRGTILHADFLEIRMDRKIKVEVPIVLRGDAPGIKQGGVLSQLLRELEVECLPIAIPADIPVDVSGVNLNGVVHVRDIVLPQGVDLVTDPEEPILTVAAPQEEQPAAEAAPAAEGEAPAGAEGAAPAAAAAESAKEEKKPAREEKKPAREEKR
ncbi:MAG: 50S ribosomal protein L25 [Nitrospinota bacterium]